MRERRGDLLVEDIDRRAVVALAGKLADQRHRGVTIDLKHPLARGKIAAVERRVVDQDIDFFAEPGEEAVHRSSVGEVERYYPGFSGRKFLCQRFRLEERMTGVNQHPRPGRGETAHQRGPDPDRAPGDQYGFAAEIHFNLPDGGSGVRIAVRTSSQFTSD